MSGLFTKLRSWLLQQIKYSYIMIYSQEHKLLKTPVLRGIKDSGIYMQSFCRLVKLLKEILIFINTKPLYITK